jgi:hypothetical protein
VKHTLLVTVAAALAAPLAGCASRLPIAGAAAAYPASLALTRAEERTPLPDVDAIPCASPATCCPEPVCTPQQNGPRGTIGGGLAFGPDLGASILGTYEFSRSCRAAWSAEVRASWLFFDNATVVNTGNDTTDADWKQLQVGVKVAINPEARTHLTGRAGLVVADVEGNLNLVRQTGTYYGGYVGFGFETQLTPRISVGPDVSVLAMQRDGDDRVYFVPQLGWNLSYAVGCVPACVPERPSCGDRDLYVGIAANAGPGLGGGGRLGQTWLRTSRASWSLEIEGVKQTLDGVFGGDTPDSDYGQFRIGGRGRYFHGRHHLVARLGFCGFKATGTNDFIDKATTYYGGYVGLGYDFDINEHWSTGPEVTLLVGVEENRDQRVQVVPQFGWQLTYWL